MNSVRPARYSGSPVGLDEAMITGIRITAAITDRAASVIRTQGGLSFGRWIRSRARMAPSESTSNHSSPERPENPLDGR